MAVPSFRTYFANQHLKEAARSVANVLDQARTSAIQSGQNQIVYFQLDPTGAALTDGSGRVVPVLLVQDGPVPAPNGVIDAGEPKTPVEAEAGVNWGVTFATGPAPGDPDPVHKFATGPTFLTPAKAAARWVVFHADGLPRSYSIAPYTEGAVGTGGGAIYLTNGARDYAVVLSPLGGVKVSAWNRGAAQWRN